MTFRVFLHPKAAGFLKKIAADIKQRIKNKIKGLEEFPERGKHLKHSNFWSLRVGDYRVIYEIDAPQKTISVLFIGHRKNVYDDFSKLF